MSDIVIAVILGIVEGVTEYLPISSTGHLIVAGHLLGFVGKTADTFEVFIQLGAILAVLYLYWSRFISLVDFRREDDTESFRGSAGLIKLGLGCLPAFIVGFLLHSYIKEHLFSPDVVSVSLIVGGIVLLFTPDKGDQPIQKIDSLTYKQALIIGLFQIFALCPGVSRSGSTIVGGILVGCRRGVAAEFSFLLAVPTMCAAVGYDLLKNIEYLSSADLPLFAVGFIVSFVTAIIAVKGFVSFLTRASLKPFGIYRIIFGGIVWMLL